MPPSTNRDPDLAKFTRAFDCAGPLTQARIAALTAILHMSTNTTMTFDQRKDLIMAALRFCEATALTNIFQHVNDTTERLATSTPQDRTNAYAFAMLKTHEDLLDKYQRMADHFFNMWELVDPSLSNKARGG